jgi:hypothetical protein
MLPLRTRRSAGLLFIMLSMLLALVVAAPVAANNPPGNNGTVKIDGDEPDNHPNNEPHVDCVFQVDFYGFDADPDPANPTYVAQVIFELHAPTAAGRTMSVTTGSLTPFIGGDDNSGGGSEAGHDASETYTLQFTGDPHPQQGYHVKLTIHAPGSQGADTKHKVFWVEPCETSTPVNPPGGGSGGGTSPGGDPPRGGALGSSSGTGRLLPDTAMDPAASSLALIAGALLLGGSAGLTLVKVHRSRSRRR